MFYTITIVLRVFGLEKCSRFVYHRKYNRRDFQFFKIKMINELKFWIR